MNGTLATQTPEEPGHGNRRRWLLPLFSLAVFALVVHVVHRSLAAYHLRDVLAHLRAIPTQALLTAGALTILSYLILTFYDSLGLRYARRVVPWWRKALTSFIAYAFGHNISLAAFTGAAIRYRLYSSVGLSAVDVATVVTFCALTTGLGLATLGGLSLAIAPTGTATALHLHHAWGRAIGICLLALVAAYLSWSIWARRSIRIGDWSLEPPGAGLAGRQLLLASIDLTVAAAVLWVLLPPESRPAFLAFAGAYAAAVLAGLVSNVPGGLGVFESVLLLSLPEVPADVLLGSLLAYRAIYYLAPLGLAALVFALLEIEAQRAHVGRLGALASAYVKPLAPQVVGLLIFLSGAVLLVSGATPAVDTRLHLLKEILPLPVLELSHLLGSVVGLGLLLLARGLFRRLSAAYHLTFWLLLVGIAASLLKGLDFEEAFLLAFVLLVLYLGRAAFYRPAAIMSQRFSPLWVVSIVVVIATVAWLGFFAHRHVEYSHDLWWTFMVKGDAPRMLRALLMTTVLAAAFLVMNLLRPAPVEADEARPEDLERVAKILPHHPDSLANVALAGDKRLLFHPQGDAFIMYEVAGRSWIALGDPVGPQARQDELVWQFRELSDRHGGRMVFYHVTAGRLPLYVDLGLSLLKLGEEARICLRDFSLEGGARAELRQACRRAVRDGASFEVVAADQIEPLFGQLKAVSDAWLEDKATGEKGFSIGAFTQAYLRHFPIAVVRSGGAIVAFANLWPGGDREELSVDLMRFSVDAPRSAMDYLFAELMLWGKTAGYSWFNLGMAPLSGLEQHPLAPAWHRVGNFVFRHAEHFYNFEGLRRYKEKFHPIWQPRYLAFPGGLALPRVLLDITALISGGVREIVSK